MNFCSNFQKAVFIGIKTTNLLYVLIPLLILTLYLLPPGKVNLAWFLGFPGNGVQKCTPHQNMHAQ